MTETLQADRDFFSITWIALGITTARIVARTLTMRTTSKLTMRRSTPIAAVVVS